MLARKKIAIIFLFLGLLILGGEGQSFGETPKAKLTVQIPFSMKGKTGLALPGSKINAYFLLESQSAEPLESKIEVLLPQGFTPQQLSPSWSVQKKGQQYSLIAASHLATQLDNWFDLLTFQVAKTLQPGSYSVWVSTEINGQITKTEYPVIIGSKEKLNNWVKLEKLLLPVNEEGKKDDKYQGDTITLRESSSEFYRSVLRGTGAVDTLAQDNHPLTYLGVQLYNTNSHPLAVLISTQLLNLKTGKPVEAFHLPENEGVRQARGEISLMADLKGEERRIIPLPLYLEEGQVKGGQYRLKTTVKLLGSNMVLASQEKKVRIITRDSGPCLVTLGAFVLCFSAAALFLCKHKIILAGFQTKELILIALFGTATFLSVNIPGTILNDLAHVFLGPFSFLITGIFNGIILYMLLISLVILIPRPGVIWLVSLVRVMLNGIALGHFTPLLFLFYLSGAVFLELALYWVGLTRPSGLQNRLTVQEFGGREIFLLAFFCALADILASYVNFQGIIFLYRLYYASWYIYFYLIINGFIYSVIGVALGVILGRKLQKISTD